MKYLKYRSEMQNGDIIAFQGSEAHVSPDCAKTFWPETEVVLTLLPEQVQNKTCAEAQNELSENVLQTSLKPQKLQKLKKIVPDLMYNPRPFVVNPFYPEILNSPFHQDKFFLITAEGKSYDTAI